MPECQYHAATASISAWQLDAELPTGSTLACQRVVIVEACIARVLRGSFGFVRSLESFESGFESWRASSRAKLFAWQGMVAGLGAYACGRVFRSLRRASNVPGWHVSYLRMYALFYGGLPCATVLLQCAEACVMHAVFQVVVGVVRFLGGSGSWA